ncbi:MAG: histidine kinase [Clostridium sp.]|nr:histidine kinase [Clostridium sp.]
MDKKTKQSTYFYKLLLSLIAVSLVPIIIIGVIISNYVRKSYSDIMYNQALEASSVGTEKLNTMLEDYNTTINVLAENQKIIDVLSDENIENENLEVIYEEIYLVSPPSNCPLYILNSDRKVMFGTGKWNNEYNSKSNENWGIYRYLNEAKGENVIYNNRFVDSNKNEIIMSVGKSIIVEDKLIGYMIIDISKDTISSLIGNSNYNPLSNFVILDQLDNIIVDINNKNFEGKKFYNKYSTKELVTKESLNYRNGSGTKVEDDIKEKELNNILIKENLVFKSWKLVTELPLDILKDNNANIKSLISYGAVVSIILSASLAYFLARSIANPVEKLSLAMMKIEKGKLDTRVNINRRDEIGRLGDGFNHMALKLKAQMNNIVDKEKKIRENEIKLLQAQINPHFLYNSLDTIKWLAKLGENEKVADVAVDLGQILRNSIDIQEEYISIDESIDFLESYINIQKLRLGSKLSLDVKMEESILNEKIPKLILQPIVENSIIHGFELKEEYCKIIIVGYRSGDNIKIHIMDNGSGMDNSLIENIFKDKNTKSHIGLYNVDQRLKLYYGKDYGLEIESKKDHYTKVTINVPYKVKGD